LIKLNEKRRRVGRNSIAYIAALDLEDTIKASVPYSGDLPGPAGEIKVGEPAPLTPHSLDVATQTDFNKSREPPETLANNSPYNSATGPEPPTALRC
jgi:hypothetical protein